MKKSLKKSLKEALLLLITLASLSIEAAAEKRIPNIVVTETVVAIPEPLATYANPISALAYEPRVDLQERNIAEAQADIAIRGGTFRTTGINLGAASLIDPQTGHYTAELPISSYFLTQPEVLTGTQNSIYGFNSATGTVRYGFREIEQDLRVRVAAGTHDLNLQHGYVAINELANLNGAVLNLDLDAARSELNGTRAGGGHDFERVSARLQLVTNNSQTDLVFGYQDKFFSWPNLYVLPALHNLVSSSGVESESLQTSLAVLNHQLKYNNADNLTLTAYWRRHRDDYEFDVSNPGLFNDYLHQGSSYGLALSGNNDLKVFNLKYSGQYYSDELESTALVAGDYMSRELGKIAILPEKDFSLFNENDLTVFTGFSYDFSNRNDGEFSPAAGISLALNQQEEVYIEYSQSTQVPGYTAIGSSSEAGLFRGNQNLGRETSQNTEIGYRYQDETYGVHLAGFYRQDNDLVDWVFQDDLMPFGSRSAANVDIDVFGLETVLSANYDRVDVILGYTYLQKNENFNIADVNASFYALNFPNHRMTAAFIYEPCELISLRADNEYRVQEDNNLRMGEDDALFTALTASMKIPEYEQLSLQIGVDNIFKTNFQDVPGVPGRGRLFFAGLEYKL